MTKNQLLIDSFVHYLAVERRYSNETVKAYKQDLEKFQRFLSSTDEDSLLKVRLLDVRLFLSYCDEQELSRTSISRHLSSLRSFYRLLVREQHLTENPTAGLTFKNRTKRLPKFLYDEELAKLFETAQGDSPLEQRNIAILELLYATGIRVSEARSIRMQDIDFTLGVILVVGKGQKERFVPFGRKAKEALLLYIKDGRSKLLAKNKQQHDVLLVNHLGEPLTTMGMEYILKQLMKKSGMTGNLHPHMLRHTFATDLLNGGADMRTVQEMMGHASLSSTQIYTHVTKDALQRNYQAFHPRAKRKTERYTSEEDPRLDQ